MRTHPRYATIATLACALFAAAFSYAETVPLDAAPWIRNGFAVARFQIQGTGGRNNPIRRRLNSPFQGDELFVRYRLRYDAKSIDLPEEGNGEFFVLWLDTVEGNEGSTHSGGVPNLGLHVSENQNRFMIRFRSGAEKHATQLEGDRDYLLVGRLWKSVPGPKSPFDRLDLWVDPKPAGENTPHASTQFKSSVSSVRWIGFSTGLKTEPTDRIDVWDIALVTTWWEALDLPKPPSTPSQPQQPPRRTVEFAQHVVPILKRRCFDCHSGGDAEEGVRLDVFDEVLNRSRPFDAMSSRLFQLVASGEMPPDEERLTDNELDILKRWINEGLVWDEKLYPTPAPTTDHWAYQPVQRPHVPTVESDWVRTPIDAFIARAHQKQGLKPAAPATSEQLARRISLDLLGLPPSHTKISADLELNSLLRDRAFGERWARHWLDVARWAESNGHQHNRNRPHAWRYRDWVVESFRNDRPFDEFVRAQIAGDHLTPASDEHIVGTGFLAAARYSGNELDKEIQRNDILVDVVNTTSKAFLGVTFECAQCHTHKFDPFTIRDYYRFKAFFADGQPSNILLGESGEAEGLLRERWEIFDSVHDRLVRVRRKLGHPEPIYITPKSVVSGMQPAERTRFQELDKKIASAALTWGFVSAAAESNGRLAAPHDMRWPLPRNLTRDASTRILLRGDVQSPGPYVSPGWPSVFGPTTIDEKPPRVALADWIVNEGNPLTARVWVNRLWQWHFGRGLVETSDNFGLNGARPTHPELLDYLAAEFIDSGWRSSHIHKLILSSATYRQSSRFSEKNAAKDPDNKYLWRWTPRRLEAEAIRDSILAVSGRLDAASGGPSVDSKSLRRSLYLRQRRDSLPHQQNLFDGADGITSCSRRRNSTNGLQPLWLLNSQFVNSAANDLAARAKSVDRAIELALGRSAYEEERRDLERLEKEFGLPAVCLALLNSSEFLYIP